MTKNSVYKDELRQTMEVVISTYLNLNGCMPGIEELYAELGREYAPVIAEYARRGKPMAAMAG